jgi:hypothetical protein
VSDDNHEKRRREEFANLLQEHNARVAMLEPQVAAHSLMAPDFIQRAEQQNARRAVALMELCRRYSTEVQSLNDRHAREMDEERGAPVHVAVEARPTAPPPPAKAKE